MSDQGIPPPPLPYPVPQTNGAAVASLILSVVSWFAISILGSIPAVICGHIGLSTVKNNSQTVGGKGMAIAGLIIGYLNIVASAIVVLIVVTNYVVPSLREARAHARYAK